MAGACAGRRGPPDAGPAMPFSATARARQAEGAVAGHTPRTRYAEVSPAAPAHPAVNRLPGDVAAGYAGGPPDAGYADGPPGGGYGAARGGYGDGAAAGAGAAPAGPRNPGVPSQRLSLERRPSPLLPLPPPLLPTAPP